jgi:hypothetical protein
MSAKDRVSTATEATAASVRQIRPLDLPAESPAPAGIRHHRGRNQSRLGQTLERLRQTWLIPLGAAAVVAALAVSLVIVRDAEAPGTVAGAGPASGASPGTASGSAPAITKAQAVAAIPRYFAVATQGKVSHAGQASIDVAVRDTSTGKTVASATLPAVAPNPSGSMVGVSVTGDDRTFIVARLNIYSGLTYFQVHIAPGTKQAATVTKLPIPDVAPGALLGFAVSPDGQQLAVLSERGNGTTLRVYSVKTGATLRSWTAGTWRYQGYGVLQPGVSWTADSRQVAFATGQTTTGPLIERVISASAPSGDLSTAGRDLFTAPASCTSLLLTPDGGTVVCATTVNYPPGLPVSSGGCGPDHPEFATYSVATGRQLSVLYQYTGDCSSAEFTVLWADNSARHVIGVSQVEANGQSLFGSSKYGVVASGTFTKLPVPPLGQWSAQPAW